MQNSKQKVIELRIHLPPHAQRKLRTLSKNENNITPNKSDMTNPIINRLYRHLFFQYKDFKEVVLEWDIKTQV